MALFNEIQVGRYNRFLQKLLGMKGPVPAPQLASEIFPTLRFEDFGVENRYMMGWDRFALDVFQGAGGIGNLSAIRFRNPANSNVIAVFEKLHITNPLLEQVVVNGAALTADLLTVLTAAPSVDSRGRSAPTLIVSETGNFGALPASLLFVADHGATAGVEMILTQDQEIPILPGSALTIISNTSNQALRVDAVWRERFLEESERT